jgi:hypothetical protein
VNRRIPGRLLLTFGLAVAAIVPLASNAESAGAAAATCDARNPLSPNLVNDLANRYPSQRISIQVTDISGCTYTLHPEYRIGTASIVKVEFMAGVLLRAQNEGRGLTQWEQDHLWPMITRSDNTAASQVWSYLGQDPGMQQVDTAFGLTDTQHSGAMWGSTTTSVADQVRLVSEVIPGLGGPLAAPYRAIAKYYMTNVIPEQQGGASSGVPDGWTVSIKDGAAGSQCCWWRIGTVGWVDRPDGTGWAIAIMSDGWPDQQSGTEALAELGGRINRTLVDPYFGGASSVYTDTTHADVFARAVTGTIRHRTWSAASGFSPWTDIGGIAMSDPDVAPGRPNVAPDVFVVGTDSAVYQGFSTAQGYGFASLGGICTSGSSAVYSGAGRLDVFCRGTDGEPWTRTWKSGTGWSAWTAMGGSITSDPDAASPGDAANLTLFVRGTDNAVWQYVPNGSHWIAVSLGGICTSGPSGVYSGNARLDVFCRGTDGQPWTRTWTPPNGWSPWAPMGGQASSDVDAVSQGNGYSPQLFARGTDGAVWQWVGDQGGWRAQSWGTP